MLNYKCLRCGAPIGYKPGTDTATCDYCMGVFTVKELDDFARAQAAKEAAEKATGAARDNNPSGGPGTGSTQSPTGIAAEFPGPQFQNAAGGRVKAGPDGAPMPVKAEGPKAMPETVSAESYLLGEKASGAAVAAGAAGVAGSGAGGVYGGAGAQGVYGTQGAYGEQAAYGAQAGAGVAPPAEPGNLVLYHCQDCGADIVADPATAATICAYCHNPVIMVERLSGQFAPAKVLPFKADKEKVKQMIKEQIAKKFFVPKSFSAESQFDKIKGVYLPFWNLNAMVDIHIEGQGEIVTTRRSGDTEYTTTKVYSFDKSGQLDLQNVSAYASKKIEAVGIESITPFDEDEAKDYSPAYITGFYAENFDLDAQGVKPQIDKLILNETNKKIKELVNKYTSVEYSRKDAVTTYDTPYLILKPVYIMSYRYQGKRYLYTINGQNLKYYGEIPLNKTKLVIASILSGLAFSGIAYLFFRLINEGFIRQIINSIFK